jgi:hypothetical protein
MYGIKVNFADDPEDKPGTLAATSNFKREAIFSAWVSQKIENFWYRNDDPKDRGVFTVWHLGRNEKVWPKA